MSNRMPSAASRSRWGVCTSPLPYAPESHQRWSSEMIRRMSGDWFIVHIACTQRAGCPASRVAPAASYGRGALGACGQRTGSEAASQRPNPVFCRALPPKQTGFVTRERSSVETPTATTHQNPLRFPPPRELCEVPAISVAQAAGWANADGTVFGPPHHLRFGLGLGWRYLRLKPWLSGGFEPNWALRGEGMDGGLQQSSVPGVRRYRNAPSRTSNSTAPPSSRTKSNRPERPGIRV